MQMHYKLRDNLTYCDEDGHIIFLDVDNDRYFQLPIHLEHPFIAYAQGDSPANISGLVDMGILVADPGAESPILPCRTTAALRSVKELSLPTEMTPANPIPEVMTLVYATKIQLITRQLSSVILSVKSHRETRTSGIALENYDFDFNRICQAATAFSRARRCVPAETHCLLDSLSLLRFLSRRALRASLVFGVVPVPFSAHCWLQAGDLVLNDTVGNVNSHTPIRVV